MRRRTIVYISSLPPTKCGVAEYSAALARAFNARMRTAQTYSVRLDSDAQYPTTRGKRLSVNPSKASHVRAIVEKINLLGPEIVLLQHEFKLFGNPNGKNVVPLIRGIKSKIVTTLHTVWPFFPEPRDTIFRAILRRSDRLLVFTRAAALILLKKYEIEREKVHVIPHGVPQVGKFVRRAANSSLSAVKVVTAGLLRPTKGIEDILSALGQLKGRYPAVNCVICGREHPRNPAAKGYVAQLKAKARHLGLQDNVIFVNRYLSESDFIATISGCDIGILAYTARNQSSSGMLALFLACGKPVIATEFQYSLELICSNNGILVRAGDVTGLADAISSLAADGRRRHSMRLSNLKKTRSWTWNCVAAQHIQIFDELLKLHQKTSPAKNR